MIYKNDVSETKMKKIIIMPDSFKGSLSARDFCKITKEVLNKYFPDCEIKTFPVADGGEGTTDCFLSIGGFEKIPVRVKNAFMEGTEAYYAFNGETRVIETAACASLPSAKGRENPVTTTTYGVGQMMRHAAAIGAKRILLGLGGSCTNDAGAGMARGAGVKFFDRAGKEFIPVGGTLDLIANFDDGLYKKEFADIEITAMCDIDNVLYGESGAAFVFAPQKGADEKTVKLLDGKLKAVADFIHGKTGKSYHSVKGAGAAGGMGFGVCAFLGGKLKSGTDAVLDAIEFEKEAESANLIITGEGKLDRQSLSGKAVVGICRRAKKLGVPVIALTGAYTQDYIKAYCEGLTAVFSTNTAPMSLRQATADIEKNLSATIENIAKILLIKKG